MRTCLFCDSTKLNREHVWPDWVSRLFHPKPQRGQYTVERKGTNEPTKRFSAKAIDQKARVVCEPCNHGWMSDLETLATSILKPILYGQRTALDCDAQATITAWIVLRAMIQEHTATKGAKHYYSSEETRRFADPNQPMEPPQGMWIWLAEYRHKRYRRIRCDVQNLAVAAVNAELNGPTHHVQVITGIVGRFVYQVLVGRWPTGRQLELDSSPVLDWSPETIQLCPHSADILIWPPDSYLTRLTAEPFANRWAEGISLNVRL